MSAINPRRRRRAKPAAPKGFTLIELMLIAIGLAILALLVTMVYPKLSTQVKRSALATTLNTLQTGADRFYLGTNRAPTFAQPADTIVGQELDWNAADGRGSAFIPDYLRFAPETQAARQGLDPAAGVTVYFGVACTGQRVFVTQTPPTDHAWTDPNTLVYTQANLAGPVRLADACYQSGWNSVAGITLWSSATEAQVGETIVVTGQVTDAGGTGVEGVDVLVTVTGTISGSQDQNVTTGQDGYFSVDITPSEPEYIIVSAKAL